MCSKFAFHVISPFLWQESHVDAVVETARLPTDSLAAPGGPPLGAAVSEPVHEPVHEAPPEEPVPEAPEPRDLTQTFEEYQSQLLFPNDGHDFGEASADKNIPNAIENGEGCPNAAKPSTPIEPEHPAPKDTLYIQWGSRCVCVSQILYIRLQTFLKFLKLDLHVSHLLVNCIYLLVACRILPSLTCQMRRPRRFPQQQRINLHFATMCNNFWTKLRS